jgi:hypothetical protein
VGVCHGSAEAIANITVDLVAIFASLYLLARCDRAERPSSPARRIQEILSRSGLCEASVSVGDTSLLGAMVIRISRLGICLDKARCGDFPHKLVCLTYGCDRDARVSYELERHRLR